MLVVTAASLSLPSVSHLLSFSSSLSFSPSHPAIIIISIIIDPPAHQPYYSLSPTPVQTILPRGSHTPPRYTFSFPIRSSLRLPVCPIEFPLTAVRDQCFVQFSSVQFSSVWGAPLYPRPNPSQREKARRFPSPYYYSYCVASFPLPPLSESIS